MYSQKKEPESVYCGENKWGYKLNINHPVINRFYKQYKEDIGAGNYPLSDAERLEFELRWFKWLENNNLAISGGQIVKKALEEAPTHKVNKVSKNKAWERD